jgi:hypothetical protein
LKNTTTTMMGPCSINWLAFQLALLLLTGESTSNPISSREAPQLEAICKMKYPDITPLDDPNPAYQWDNKAEHHPREYLKGYPKLYDKPFGKKVARWEYNFFNPGEDVDDDDLEYRDVPIEPFREDAATIITYFYPSEDEGFERRPLEVYMERFKILAKANQQMLVYVPDSIAEEVEKIRTDPHFVVIKEWKSVWDFPNNQYQEENFREKQPVLFKSILEEFERSGPGIGIFGAEYEHAHLNAAYNAKAFITYDAIMRK